MEFSKQHRKRTHCTVCLHPYNYVERPEVKLLFWAGYVLSIIFSVPAFVRIVHGCPPVLHAPLRRVVVVTPPCLEQFLYTLVSVVWMLAGGVDLFMPLKTTRREKVYVFCGLLVTLFPLALSVLFDPTRLALPITLGVLLFFEQLVLLFYVLFEFETE